MTYAQSVLFARMSNWIDGQKQQRMSPDHWTDHRVLKVCEESGEVMAALHNARGANPRKIGENTMADVLAELLDTAAAALCAVEHLTGNQCRSVDLLTEKMGTTLARVGIPITED